MSSQGISEVGGPATFLSSQKAEDKPSKLAVLAFAIPIILAIGGLIVAVIGAEGMALPAGSFAHLGEVNSIVMMVIGSTSTIALTALIYKITNYYDAKRHLRTSVGAVEANPGTTHIKTKIAIKGHKIELAGIFSTDCKNEKKEVNYLAQQLPLELQQALQMIDLSNSQAIDEMLKKIFSKLWSHLPKGDQNNIFNATCHLIIDETIYISNIGDSHAVLVVYESTEKLGCGCYQVSYRQDNDLRNIYIPQAGHPRGVLLDNAITEVTENWSSGVPKISHLIRGVSNYRDKESPLTAHSYQKGDYLILGCSNFFNSVPLSTCYEIVKKQGAKGKDPQSIANALIEKAYNQTTVVVIKL